MRMGDRAMRRFVHAPPRMIVYGKCICFLQISIPSSDELENTEWDSENTPHVNWRPSVMVY